MYGQTRAIELLVSRGAEVNAQVRGSAKWEGQTSPSAPGRRGEANGWPLCMQDLRGRTPLYYAMHNDELEAVRRLLSLKADPTVMDEDGCTARTGTVGRRAGRPEPCSCRGPDRMESPGRMRPCTGGEAAAPNGRSDPLRGVFMNWCAPVSDVRQWRACSCTSLTWWRSARRSR